MMQFRMDENNHVQDMYQRQWTCPDNNASIGLLTETGLLHPGVSHIHGRGQGIEFKRPMEQVDITFRGATRNRVIHDRGGHEHVRHVEQAFTVWVPPLHYRMHVTDGYIQNLCLWVRQTTPSGRERWGLLPLPNAYTNGQFCLGVTPPHASTLAEVQQIAYDLVWGSVFNTDIMDLPRIYLEQNTDLARLTRERIPDDLEPSTVDLLKTWSLLGPEEVDGLRWAEASVSDHTEHDPVTHPRVDDVINQLHGQRVMTPRPHSDHGSRQRLNVDWNTATTVTGNGNTRFNVTTGA